MHSESVHRPVLLNEVIDFANLKPGQVMVDGTLGGGGHSRKLIESLSPGGMLLGLDRDPDAIHRTQAGLEALAARLSVVTRTFQKSYAELGSVLGDALSDFSHSSATTSVDGILLDLGLSSDQLDQPGRGFAFRLGGPLDLRFDHTQGQSAAEWLAMAEQEEIQHVLREYGEERLASKIARRIVEQRISTAITSTAHLVDVVSSVVRGPNQRDSLARVFQALRIQVNSELQHLEQALKNLPGLLRPGGRMLIISFHSLEDRMVKRAFRNDQRLKVLTPSPIVASTNESIKNPRSKSAKLRVAESVGAQDEDSQS